MVLRHYRKFLEVTMFSVSAVVIATSRTISATHSNAYLQHMIDYLNGIKEFFPGQMMQHPFRLKWHISLSFEWKDEQDLLSAQCHEPATLLTIHSLNILLFALNHGKRGYLISKS
jgi:hypothetical protein